MYYQAKLSVILTFTEISFLRYMYRWDCVHWDSHSFLFNDVRHISLMIFVNTSPPCFISSLGIMCPGDFPSFRLSTSSKLSPVLFLKYIIVLPSIFGIDINIALFADDTKLSLQEYIREIYSPKKLDKIGSWSNDMDLQIVSNKCDILSTGLRTNLPYYYINNVGLLIIKRSRNHL